MRLGTVTQQPIERFSYTINYVDALAPGDSVETATAITRPAGLTVSDVSPLDPRVKFWVEGGEDGTKYTVEVTVHTRNGAIFQDEIVVKVKEVL